MKTHQRAARQHKPNSTRPRTASKPVNQFMDAGVQREALQRAQRSPATLSAGDILALQRMIGNAAVGRLLRGHSAGGQPVNAPAGPGVVQRLRSYDRAPGSGGLGYKMVKLDKEHVKYHPTADPLFFNEFHVTFELFKDDTKCPKMYFSDQGKPDTSHDDERVFNEWLAWKDRQE